MPSIFYALYSHCIKGLPTLARSMQLCKARSIKAPLDHHIRKLPSFFFRLQIPDDGPEKWRAVVAHSHFNVLPRLMSLQRLWRIDALKVIKIETSAKFHSLL